MKFDILTLFPEMFAPLEQSIIGRAVENNRIEINLTNIRDFSKDKHKKVDDTPYGGGKGMVIRPDVVYDAYMSDEIEQNDDIEDALNQTADIINEMGEISQDTITEADAEALNDSMLTLLDVLDAVVDAM